VIGDEDLRDLYAKYMEIAALRGTSLTKAAARPRMAALAARFPGALRELDALSVEEIAARQRALAGALAGRRDDVAPWMVAQSRYHALARGALSAKRWLGRTRVVEAGHRARFESAAAARPAREPEEWLAWTDHLAALAAPRGGRIVPLVVHRVAHHLGVSVAEARALIFPPIGGTRHALP